MGLLIILTIASAFVVEAPLGPGLVQDVASHVTVTVLLRPETRELFTSVQATPTAAVVADETVIVAVVPVSAAVPVTCTADGAMLWKNIEPRQSPLLVEEGAVHQIQKPNCAGPEHVAFLQEKELGSALALKTIAGEAVVFWPAADCVNIRKAAIAPQKRTVTRFRRVAIAISPRVFNFDFVGVNCICANCVRTVCPASVRVKKKDAATSSWQPPETVTGVFANAGSSVFFISGSIVNNGTGFQGYLSGMVCADGN